MEEKHEECDTLSDISSISELINSIDDNENTLLNNTIILPELSFYKNECNKLIDLIQNYHNNNFINKIVEDNRILNKKNINLVIDDDGNTPLLLACKYGNIEAYKYIIYKFKNVNLHYVNKYNQNYILVALENENVNVLSSVFTYSKLDLDCNFYLKFGILSMCCVYNNLDLIKEICEHIDVKRNKKVLKFMAIIACVNNHIDIVKYFYFIYNKIINARNKNNDTLLHIAIRNENFKLVEFLLDKKLELVDKKNNKGNTPLHIACIKNNNKIVKFICSKSKISVINQNYNNKMPYHLVKKENIVLKAFLNKQVNEVYMINNSVPSSPAF